MILVTPISSECRLFVLGSVGERAINVRNLGPFIRFIYRLCGMLHPVPHRPIISLIPFLKMVYGARQCDDSFQFEWASWGLKPRFEYGQIHWQTLIFPFKIRSHATWYQICFCFLTETKKFLSYKRGFGSSYHW
jgi:hypothetical protein